MQLLGLDAELLLLLALLMILVLDVSMLQRVRRHRVSALVR